MYKPIILILYNFAIGTAGLIYGVKLLSRGLESASFKTMEKILAFSSKNVLFSFIIGTLSTAAVQSSTAVTVITVGLVNSNIIKLPQAIGIIYGANIGTTITAQLISFDITFIALPLLLMGVLLKFFIRKSTGKNLSEAIIGFGLMLLGIKILNLGVPYVKQSEFMYKLFTSYGRNPFLAVLIGMITTMLIHSSSAAVGLTIVLFNAGLISLDSAIGLTLGDNIGTCVTAQIASIGTSMSAKRTAWAHTIYNIIGAVSILFVLIPFRKTVEYVTFTIGQDKTRLVANVHTIFNILSAVVFLPITKYYVKFIEWLIPE